MAKSKTHTVKVSQVSDDLTNYKFLFIKDGKSQSKKDIKSIDKIDTFTYRGLDKIEYAIDLRDLDNVVMQKMTALDARSYVSQKLKMDEIDFGRALNDAQSSAQF